MILVLFTISWQLAGEFEKTQKCTSKQWICGHIMYPGLSDYEAKRLTNLSWLSGSTVFVVSFLYVASLDGHPKSEMAALIPGGFVCPPVLKETLRLADTLTPAVPTKYLQKSNTMEQSFLSS